MRGIFTFIAFSILLSACQVAEDQSDITVANFAMLEEVGREVETEVGVFGGSGKRLIQPVQSSHVTYTFTNEILQLDFDTAAYLKVSPKAIGLPQKWQGVSSVSLQITTEKPTDLLLELWGRRSRLQYPLQLKEGIHEYQIDVREIPLLGGLESEVLQLNFQFVSSGSLQIHELKLNAASADIPLVDQWGQRRLAEYPGKISHVDELASLPAENTFLDSLEFSFRFDEYGGFSEHGLPLHANGFFHTQQIGNKWYLVTPLGNPFYSLGLNGVRRKSTLNNAALTRVKGRESLFEKLPAYTDCPECFSPDSAYLSFYCQNVKAKYPSYAEWKKQTARRLRKIGFNTIGNWSDSLFLGGPIPYTFTLDTRVFTRLRAAKSLPDVFHPDWAHRLDSAFASIARLSTDAFLLGYFVDNEMPWGGIAELDEQSYSYKALSQYASLSEKQEAFAEKYFSIIKRLIQKYDPNHLYLGCRFTRNLEAHQTVAKVAGKYLDVLSVNAYSPFTPGEMDAWYETVKRPMLIGEHHIPPQTGSALRPRYKAFPLDRRDKLVNDYLQTWIAYPYAVGSHWYQYVDQEIAGRGDGGENQPVGLVNVTDQLNRRLASVFFEFAQTIPENYIE